MDFDNVRDWIRFSFYILFAIFVCLLFYYRIVIITFEKEKNQTLSMIYTLMTALLFGMYLNALGVDTMNPYFKYIFLIAVIILLLFSVSEFGFRFELRQSVVDWFWDYFKIGRPLRYTFIQSNNEKAILFFVLNIPILLILYGISFIFEHEVE